MQYRGHIRLRDSYLCIAKRNLKMARLLHCHDFFEGATFHAYHVFECVISAGIASQNQQIPRRWDRPGVWNPHAQKILDFRRHCLSKITGTSFEKEFGSISTLLQSLADNGMEEEVRNYALYRMKGKDPQDRFMQRDSSLLTQRACLFFNEAQKLLPKISV